MKIDKERAVFLKERGFTYQYIADEFGCTRQAVHQLLCYVAKPPRTREIRIRKVNFCRLCGLVARRVYCSPCSAHLGEGRSRTRQLARIRDNYTCQDCGVIRTPQSAISNRKRLFDVHHLQGLCGKKSRGYDSERELHLLITLCHKCHYNRPEHRVKSRHYKK